jgi:hypothetical protein
MSTHKYVGEAAACALIIERAGQPPQYCGKPLGHPEHTGTCIHCSYALDFGAGDKIDVCRFCPPNYGVAVKGRQPRCESCATGRRH